MVETTDDATSTPVGTAGPVVRSRESTDDTDGHEAVAAVKAIAEARIAGKISEEDFQRQMEDENDTLQAGTAMVRVVEKKMMQDAINAALKVFSEAVKAAAGAAP